MPNNPSFKASDAGKGPDDRSTPAKRSSCPAWKVVRLSSGVNLDPEEAAAAIEAAEGALRRLDGVRTGDCHQPARDWFQKYFPNKTV